MLGRRAQAAFALLLVGPALAAALSAPLEAAPTPAATSLAAAATYPLGSPDPFDYSDVVLLGNNNSATSRNLTDHFQQVHAVPANNVMFADLPDAETISQAQWNAFAAWFTGEMANRSLGAQINYIVTFKGIPIRVNWPGINGPSSFQDALMLLGGPLEGAIGSANLYANPYFNHTERFSYAQFGIRLVTGIYAYNESTAISLIDRAASSLGSRGEFVLDADSTYGFTGGHDQYGYANNALIWANATLSAAGWPTYLDTTSTYITGRSNTMGYSSWGSNACCWSAVTQNALPHNTWVNGSLAESFVSTGGRTFTWPPSYGQSLIADWIDEGANAMKGYTDEPYIGAIADAHILYGRYVRGYNTAESYWSASHYVGWRQIVVGDPKMAAYADIGNLRVNGTLAQSPAPVVQFGNTTAVFGIDNTAPVAKTAEVRAFVAGVAVANWTVTLPADSSSSFAGPVDLAGLAPSLWGNQSVTIVVDPDGVLVELDKADNAVALPLEVRRLPVPAAQLGATSVLTRAPVLLVLNASVADRPLATFEVRTDGGPAVSIPAALDTAQFETQFNRSGSHSFWVVAVDSAGLRSLEVGPFTVVILNRAPSAAVAANETAPLSLDMVRLNASLSVDPDGTIVAYRWTVAGATVNGSSNFETAVSLPGNYTVVVQVTDDEGASANASMQLTVRNRPPIPALAANVTSVPTLTPVAFSGAASLDPDGTVTTYAFAYDDGVIETFSTATSEHAFARPGAQGLWLMVTDDWGATARVRLTVVVTNRAPAVVWVEPAPTAVPEGVSTTFAAHAEDLDGALATYTLDFGDGRRSTRVLSGASWAIAEGHPFAAEGPYVLRLTVTDDSGDSTTVTLDVQVSHPAPEVASADVRVENGALAVTYSVSSPYGGLELVVQLDGAWWREVGIEGEGTYSQPVPSLAPGNHTFHVFVTDGTKSTEIANQTFHVAESSLPPPPPPPPPSTPAPSAAWAALAVAGAALLIRSLRRPRPRA